MSDTRLPSLIPLPGCMIGPSEPCESFVRLQAELAAANKLIDDEKTGKLISYLNVLAQENKILRRMSHADRAEKAEAERDALREDAERYRWLREKISADMQWYLLDKTVNSPSGLDAAIDAARAK